MVASSPGFCEPGPRLEGKFEEVEEKPWLGMSWVEGLLCCAALGGGGDWCVHEPVRGATGVSQERVCDVGVCKGVCGDRRA